MGRIPRYPWHEVEGGYEQLVTRKFLTYEQWEKRQFLEGVQVGLTLIGIVIVILLSLIFGGTCK